MELDPDEIRNKLEGYSNFLKQVLNPQYEAAQKVENVVKCEIVEYETLQHKIQSLLTAASSTSDTSDSQKNELVDLGYKKIYCNASFIFVNDDDVRMEEQKLFVDVGMGLLLELTFGEALRFIERKLHFLKSQKLPKRSAKCREIKRHILESELILDQLALELNNSR